MTYIYLTSVACLRVTIGSLSICIYSDLDIWTNSKCIHDKQRSEKANFAKQIKLQEICTFRFIILDKERELYASQNKNHHQR